jgi:hypothetical protein
MPRKEADIQQQRVRVIMKGKFFMTGDSREEASKGTVRAVLFDYLPSIYGDKINL